MTELRENARCIFWSGALAFEGQKIMFLHDKNEELLVEMSSCILCKIAFFSYFSIPSIELSRQINTVRDIHSKVL